MIFTAKRQATLKPHAHPLSRLPWTSRSSTTNLYTLSRASATLASPSAASSAASSLTKLRQLYSSTCAHLREARSTKVDMAAATVRPARSGNLVGVVGVRVGRQP